MGKKKENYLESLTKSGYLFLISVKWNENNEKCMADFDNFIREMKKKSSSN